MKVFLTISATLLFFSFITAIYSAIYLGGVFDTTVAILLISAVQFFIFGLLAELIVRKRSD